MRKGYGRINGEVILPLGNSLRGVPNMTQPEMLRVFLKGIGFYFIIGYAGVMPRTVYYITASQFSNPNELFELILYTYMPDVFPFVAGFVLLFATRWFVNLAYPEVKTEIAEETNQTMNAE
jgi:hypothetical protein